MAYEKLNWQNGKQPALNAENLNHLEDGIVGAYSAANQALEKANAAGLSFGVLYFNNAPSNSLERQVKTIMLARELFNKFKLIVCDCVGDTSNKRGYSVLMAKTGAYKWEGNLVTTVPVKNNIVGRYVTLESTSETEATLTIDNGFLGSTLNSNHVAILVQVIAIY